jgi:hypothetical protein
MSTVTHYFFPDFKIIQQSPSVTLYHKIPVDDTSGVEDCDGAKRAADSPSR